MTPVSAGDIHIWDRESGALLQHFPAHDLEGDLTCIAWNHAAPTVMFSTGSHDGGVKIWTAPMAAVVAPTPQRVTAAAATSELPQNSIFNWSSESIQRSESPIHDDDFPDEATEYSSADNDLARLLNDRRAISFLPSRLPI